jgi:putative ABC transport system permease protein
LRQGARVITATDNRFQITFVTFFFSQLIFQFLPTSIISRFDVALALFLLCGAGVIIKSSSQRLREMGIHLAIGAQPKDLLGMVIWQGMIPALAGLGLGMALAVALTRLIANQLYQVSPTDPASFALVTLLLAIIALTACYFPALRAIRVDPIKALREE